VFKKELSETLHNIFGIPKVSFDNSGDKEQNILFVDVASNVTVAKKTKVTAKVTGTLRMYAPNDKLTFGFFAKKLHTCSPSDQANLFFYEMDQSGEYYGNLVERTCNFVYFFQDHYDPEDGELDEIEFSFVS
jgi:hypothetical protein